MPRARFVVPSTRRMPLTEGDWIEVKKELSYGEALELNNAFVGDNFDQRNYNLLRAALWIVDWSFEDMHGNHVTWPDDADEALGARELLEQRKTLVGSLDRATGREIVAVINQIESEADEEREGKAPEGMEGMKIDGSANEVGRLPSAPAPIAVPASA